MSTVEIEVEDPAWTAALPNAEAVVRSAALAALAGEDGREVTVLLTGDGEVRALNRDFRGKDGSTNVLSFPAPETARPHLGDIALACGVCGAEAAAQGKALSDHLSHLTVHGVLHLLGYDHAADDEAEAMEAMERTILEGLGIADPYACAPDA